MWTVQAFYLKTELCIKKPEYIQKMSWFDDGPTVNCRIKYRKPGKQPTGTHQAV